MPFYFSMYCSFQDLINPKACPVQAGALRTRAVVNLQWCKSFGGLWDATKKKWYIYPDNIHTPFNISNADPKGRHL